jgi:hypothetical protein
MAGENRLRAAVVKILKPLNAQPVENIVKVGTPDVEFHGGWIEVKRTVEWPVRATTVVSLDHDLTLEQRIWIKRRSAVGGTVWVLVQIDKAYLLFRGMDAVELIGKANQKELIAGATQTCLGLAALKRNLLSWVK